MRFGVPHRRHNPNRDHSHNSECLSGNPALKHKWQSTQELDTLCKEVEWQMILKGSRAHTDRSGLGFNKRKALDRRKEREMVLQLSETYTEEDRYLHCLKLEHFCEWVKWDGVMVQDRNWSQLIQRDDDDELLRFSLAATKVTLVQRETGLTQPCPSWMQQWQCLGIAARSLHMAA